VRKEGVRCTAASKVRRPGWENFEKLGIQKNEDPRVSSLSSREGGKALRGQPPRQKKKKFEGVLRPFRFKKMPCYRRARGTLRCGGVTGWFQATSKKNR